MSAKTIIKNYLLSDKSSMIRNSEKYLYLFQRVLPKKYFTYLQVNLAYLNGIYHYNKFEYKEAILYFKKVIEIKGCSHPSAIKWLAKSYKEVEQYNDAKQLLEDYGDYAKKEIYTLSLADSAGYLEYIEQKYIIYFNSSQKNSETTKWFIKYLLRHKYWGRAYIFIKEIENKNTLNDFLLSTKNRLKSNFSAVGINIEKEYKLDSSKVKSYRSNELVYSEIIKRVKKNNNKIIKTKKIERVALVLLSLAPGGAERQCINLFNGLLQKVEEGEIGEVRLYLRHLTRYDRESFYLHEVTDKSKVYEFYDKKNPINIDDVKSLNLYKDLVQLIQPEKRQQSLISLTKHLEEFSPTVIHGWQNEPILSSFLIGSILGTPSLFGRWGSFPPDFSRNITEVQRRNIAYMQYAYKALVKDMEHKIFSANSSASAKANEVWIDEDNINAVTVYNGLNMDKLTVTISREDILSNLGLPQNSIIVGSIYRIADVKRPILWGEIAKIVIEKYGKNVHFILIGDGALKNTLERFVYDNNLENNIHLLGRHDDVANWYNIMDIFLLTSSIEGVSNSMIEAEYMGVPVVVSDVGGLKEALIDGKTGFLIKSNDALCFANKIIEIFNGGWSTEDKAYSKKYIEEKFSIANMVENTLHFYRKNLDDKFI